MENAKLIQKNHIWEGDFHHKEAEIFIIPQRIGNTIYKDGKKWYYSHSTKHGDAYQDRELPKSSLIKS